MRRFCLLAAFMLSMSACHADAPQKAPIKTVHQGKAMTFVIQYPKSDAESLPAYHSTALDPPRPAAPPPAPKLPFKVPKFANKLVKKYDALKARLDKFSNPQVRMGKTQGTLTGDMSGNNKSLTLRVPFDTGQPHPFDNLGWHRATAPSKTPTPSPTPFQ